MNPQNNDQMPDEQNLQEPLPREYFVGKGPKGYERSDERIQEEIWKMLMHEHGLDLTEIEVDVKGGEVTLMGTLPDRQMRFRIEELTAGLSGVNEVHNQIHVLKDLDAGLR